MKVRICLLGEKEITVNLVPTVIYIFQMAVYRIDYIYYLQYTEEETEIIIKTKDADFYVYESAIFKVN